MQGINSGDFGGVAAVFGDYVGQFGDEGVYPVVTEGFDQLWDFFDTKFPDRCRFVLQVVQIQLLQVLRNEYLIILHITSHLPDKPSPETQSHVSPNS